MAHQFLFFSCEVWILFHVFFIIRSKSFFITWCYAIMWQTSFDNKIISFLCKGWIFNGRKLVVFKGTDTLTISSYPMTKYLILSIFTIVSVNLSVHCTSCTWRKYFSILCFVKIWSHTISYSFLSSLFSHFFATFVSHNKFLHYVDVTLMDTHLKNLEFTNYLHWNRSTMTLLGISWITTSRFVIPVLVRFTPNCFQIVLSWI